jgi:hypothetical protein
LTVHYSARSIYASADWLCNGYAAAPRAETFPELRMNATPTQDARIAELTTAARQGRLVLVRFDATEGLSELFDLRVDCASEEPITDLSPLARQGGHGPRLHDSAARRAISPASSSRPG